MNTECIVVGNPKHYRESWVNVGPGAHYRIQVTRFVYEQEHGAIPEGLFILHSCDTPNCINVDHLRAGTQRDNMLDKVKRGRHSNGRGPSNTNQCRNGHEFTAENTYVNRRGARECRTCRKAAQDRFHR